MNGERNIDNEEKVKGTWWRAEHPETQVPGEITYSPTSGAVVDLFGALVDDGNPGQLRQRFTLHGLTVRGQHVSLFEAAVSRSQLHIPGGRTSVVSSVRGVVGGHYGSPDDVLFAKVRVTFTGLRDWTWISGIETQHEEQPRRAIYTETIPDDIAVGAFEGIDVKLQFSSSTNPGAGSLTIREDCDLVLEASSPVPYERFETVLYTFQKFLSFALQRPVHAPRIVGHTDTPRQVIQGHRLFQDYVIIRKLSAKKWDREELIPQDMLFTLSELDQPAGFAFGCFYKEQRRLKPSLDLYLSTLYNPTQLVRAQFLTLAQAVEGYHRVTMPGAYVSEEDYSPVKAALSAAIPTGVSRDFRESLKSRFKYLNEFSLRKRVEALAEKHSDCLATLLGPARPFASRISDVRNALTHPTPSSSDGQPDGTEIWHLSEKLALLLEVCFLDELGFSSSRVRRIMSERSERARRVHYGAF